MNLLKIGEFGLISRLTRGLGRSRFGTVVGVGDDTSVLDVGGDRFLLATCDAQIEGVHFKFDWSKPEEVGRRASAVNLSDIASMGGEPAFALISLMVPSDLDVNIVDGIYRGLTAGFDRWNVEIVGGNTARSPGSAVIDVSLLGFASKDRVLLRNGAKPGDAVCVTGDLGAAVAGLEIMKSSQSLSADFSYQAAKKAYLTPTPRVAEGQVLSGAGGVTSCIDISDGLLGDAKHIAASSGVSLNIDLDRLPISDETREICAAIGMNVHTLALTGGEDFELLFTTKPEFLGDIGRKLLDETGTSMTMIGEVQGGDGTVNFEQNGTVVDINGRGFDHFEEELPEEETSQGVFLANRLMD